MDFVTKLLDQWNELKEKIVKNEKIRNPMNSKNPVILGQIKVVDIKRFIVKKEVVGQKYFLEIQKKSSELLFGQLAVEPEGKVYSDFNTETLNKSKK